MHPSNSTTWSCRARNLFHAGWDHIRKSCSITQAWAHRVFEKHGVRCFKTFRWPPLIPGQGPAAPLAAVFLSLAESRVALEESALRSLCGGLAPTLCGDLVFNYGA